MLLKALIVFNNNYDLIQIYNIMNRLLHLYLRPALFLFLFLFSESSLFAISHSMEWLSLNNDNKKNWTIRYLDKNHSTIYIRSRGENHLSRADEKKIFSIISKESSSYVLALNKLLEVLHQEEIKAQVTVRNFEENEQQGIRLLQEAERKQVDLIFTLGSTSAALVHKHFQGKQIPVVTSINKDPVLLGLMKNYTEGSGTNIATTSLNISIDIQLSYLFRLIPDLKNIALLYNSNHREVMLTEVVPAHKIFIKHELKVYDVAVKSHETSKETLSQTLPKVIAEMRKSDPDLSKSIFWLTSSTAIFSQIKTINQYSENIPVISSSPNVVKKGSDSAVLAIGIDRRNNAHMASIYAVSILRGEARAGDLRVGVVTPPDLAINFKVAKKIGLKIPFSFFESAAFIYDQQGSIVRSFGGPPL